MEYTSKNIAAVVAGVISYFGFTYILISIVPSTRSVPLAVLPALVAVRIGMTVHSGKLSGGLSQAGRVQYRGWALALAASGIAGAYLPTIFDSPKSWFLDPVRIVMETAMLLIIGVILTSEASEVARKHEAAERGDGKAQFYLGHLYYEGKFVAKDYVTAYMWVNLAMEQHIPKASDSLMFLEKHMTLEQVAEGRRLSHEWVQKHSAKP